MSPRLLLCLAWATAVGLAGGTLLMLALTDPSLAPRFACPFFHCEGPRP
ncbi:MAG: hypothetical protein AB7O57_18875 [Hyphomicrobiaceae bacterium]